jgi:hypothetical protein
VRYSKTSGGFSDFFAIPLNPEGFDASLRISVKRVSRLIADYYVIIEVYFSWKDVDDR